MPSVLSSTDSVSYGNKDVLATYGKTFHWASFFLGEKEARSAATIYTMCRQLDDIADNIEQSASQRRTELRHYQSLLNKGHYPLAIHLIKEDNVPPLAIEELINGMICDTYDVTIDNDATLLQYCYRAAGTVGLMMCPLLKVNDSAAYRHAIDLGIAMQLTNICRDVLEDAQMGRRYIPINISPDNIVNAAPDTRLAVKYEIERLLALAEQYYTSGLNGLAYMPVRNRPAIYLAATLYRAIGRKILQHETRWWQGRCYLSNLAKFTETIQQVPGILKSIWRCSKHRHDSHLHTPLQGLPYV